MIIYEEILREFQRQKVKYVIVGGIAFNLLGGYRNTLDMDIVVEMTDKNLLKIVNILKKAGYHVKQPVEPALIADKKIREDWIKNKNLKAFNFYKGQDSYEEVDIIISTPVNFKEANKDAKKIKIGKLILPVISINNFIKMKMIAGRDKDKLDIKEIRMIGKRR